MSEPPEVRFRVAGPDDIPDLKRLFEAARDATFSLLPAAHKAFLVEAQFNAQRSQYLEMHPESYWELILVNGEPAGYLAVAEAGQITLLDIGIEPRWRHRGVGTLALNRVLGRADAQGKGIALTVRTDNPARYLYERLGFVGIDSNGMDIQMIRCPKVVESDRAMAVITLTTIDEAANANDSQAAAQTQELKSALSRVPGARVAHNSQMPAESGTKSGPGSALSFALELATSPHTISAVGVVLFEWIRHNMGKSVQLVVEGEKIVIESGSHKHVQELVDILEQKIGSRA